LIALLNKIRLENQHYLVDRNSSILADLHSFYYDFLPRGNSSNLKKGKNRSPFITAQISEQIFMAKPEVVRQFVLRKSSGSSALLF